MVPGTVLVASPYRDGDYAVLDEATERFGLAKWTAVSTLCGLLGAESLEVKVLQEENSHARREITGGGGRGPISVKATGKSTALDKFEGQMSLVDKFPGGPADIPAARHFLESCGLEGDPEVRSLVEARAHASNPLSRRTVTVDVSRESARTIDAALSVAVPALLNLSATFDQAKEDQARLKVTFDVVFSS